MMRKTIYLMLVLLGVSFTASAQSDKDAIIGAIDSIVNKFYDEHPKELNAYVDRIYDKYREDDKLATGIARAYYPAERIEATRESNNDPSYDFIDARKNRAKEYLQIALKKNPKYGPAYVLMGQMKECAYDNDSAKFFFREGIALDPTNVDNYKAFAHYYHNMAKYDKANLDSAITILRQVKVINPNYPIDIDIARLLNEQGSYKGVIDIYKDLDINTLKMQDLYSYAFNLFFKGDYEEGLKVSELGMQKYPQERTFLNMAFYNSCKGGKYEKAVQYGKKYFETCPDSLINLMDYQLYATALEHQNMDKEAIDLYTKVLELPATLKNLEDAQKLGTTLTDQKTEAKNNIMAIFVKEKKYNELFQWADNYITTHATDSIPTEYDLTDFANYYGRLVNIVPDDIKQMVREKENSMWAELCEYYPESSNIMFAYYKCMMNAYAKDGNDVTKGGAEKYALLICKHMADVTVPNSRDENIYAFALKYLSYYYFKTDRTALAKKYVPLWYEHATDPDEMNTAMRIASALKITLQ